MKKIALCFILLLALSGCDSGDPQNGKVVQTNESLTFAVPEPLESQYTTAVNVYKRLYPEVDCELVTYPYDSMEDAEGMRRKMAADLMAGKGYDLYVSASTDFEDVQKVKAAGAFENLYPYMEQDESFKKEDYVESIFSIDQKEGECYLLPYDFSVFFLGTRREILEETGINLEGCRSPGEQLACMEKYHSLYPERQITVSLGAFYPELASLGFVPWKSEKNEDVLHSPVLIRSEKLCKEEKAYEETSLEESVRSWDVFLEQGESLGLAFNNTPNFEWLCILGGAENGVMVPKLLENGKMRADSFDMTAIASSSPNKQNAWNFIKVLLDDTVQTEKSYGALPVKKSVLEQWFANQERMYAQDSVVIHGETYPGVSKEQIKMAKEQVYQAEILPPMGRVITAKYRECMEDYYQDKKPIEECLQEFEKIMKVYYSE